MGLPAKSPQAILWGPRVGGGRNIPRETCTLYFTFEPAAPSELALHECAYNPVPVGFNAFLFRAC